MWSTYQPWLSGWAASCKLQASSLTSGTIPDTKNLERINMKIEKNNFVVTFKTEKEVSDYIGMHIPEEQRLLWLGFFISNNYIAQWLEGREKKK